MLYEGWACVPLQLLSLSMRVCVQVTHLLYALYSESLVIRTPSVKCLKDFVWTSENTVNYMEQRTWRHDLCLKIASIATSLTLGRYNYVNETLSGTFQESFHNLSEIGSVLFQTYV